MALCLATGEPFLGMRVPKPVKVLMIDLENRPAPLSSRFKSMGGDPCARLHVWCARSLDSVLPDSGEEGLAFLRRLVETVRPDVLIIDPWRLWLGGDENDAREIVRGLRALASVRANSPGLAIVIVHHVRKEKFDTPRKLLADPSLWADAVSGHHALMSHVDACYGLERQVDDDENSLIVFGGIARNLEP
jgi:RecA-family ATPase